MTFYSVTIWLPDDGPRTETCRSVFNILMCKFYKFYICAVVGIIIELFLVYFVNFIYNFYMFRTSIGPSSGGTSVFVLRCVATKHIMHICSRALFAT